ncbi:MAG: spore coat associated protein CotJA [Clostridium sp.]|uniref:spore coat associated protein CotJA n=1 Tax=Clostridium sp. DSM 8431 TaxID=1761781 RepID=UPI0008DFEC63|nr:spore coat associated protein CotJA [Clostridium sp. DSM 8431]MCR4943888.1 spore coat associated protein CotJA [Clostridium sp.]SFU46089.1 Spore coat associated protein JA (CotJA) [Clostridium sp. DSM 8431]
MYYTNCDEESNRNKGMKMEYAKAYVLPQKYDNLISVKFALDCGTIFKDLVCPYKEKNYYPYKDNKC